MSMNVLPVFTMLSLAPPPTVPVEGGWQVAGLRLTIMCESS